MHLRCGGICYYHFAVSERILKLGQHLAKLEVAWWRNGYSVGLAINRSLLQILLRAVLRNNLGQVVHTYVPL